MMGERCDGAPFHRARFAGPKPFIDRNPESHRRKPGAGVPGRLVVHDAPPATFPAYLNSKLLPSGAADQLTAGEVAGIIAGGPGKSLSGVVDSWEGAVKSFVVKRSIAVDGHKTSVTLEEAFWNGLKEIAADRDLTLSELVTAVNSGRLNANLSSALRLFVFDHYRTMIVAEAGRQGSDAQRAAQSPPAQHKRD